MLLYFVFVSKTQWSGQSYLWPVSQSCQIVGKFGAQILLTKKCRLFFKIIDFFLHYLNITLTYLQEGSKFYSNVLQFSITRPKDLNFVQGLKIGIRIQNPRVVPDHGMLYCISSQAKGQTSKQLYNFTFIKNTTTVSTVLLRGIQLTLVKRF
jgi:hypothetical protein